MHIKDLPKRFAGVCELTEALLDHLLPLGHLCQGGPLLSDGTGTFCFMELHLSKEANQSSLPRELLQSHD